jgi:hypothetical protein
MDLRKKAITWENVGMQEEFQAERSGNWRSAMSGENLLDVGEEVKYVKSFDSLELSDSCAGQLKNYYF